jgi:hypothetical protein
LDLLYLFPVLPTMAQLERWTDELLPWAAQNEQGAGGRR